VVDVAVTLAPSTLKVRAPPVLGGFVTVGDVGPPEFPPHAKVNRAGSNVKKA
jgi:hypothetical protein